MPEYDPEEREEQEHIHEALAKALPLEDDAFLTEWVVVFATTPVGGGEEQIASYYGPATQTTWRTVGLLEYAKLHLVVPDEEDG